MWQRGIIKPSLVLIHAYVFETSSARVRRDNANNEGHNARRYRFWWEWWPGLPAYNVKAHLSKFKHIFCICHASSTIPFMNCKSVVWLWRAPPSSKFKQPKWNRLLSPLRKWTNLRLQGCSTRDASSHVEPDVRVVQKTWWGEREYEPKGKGKKGNLLQPYSEKTIDVSAIMVGEAAITSLQANCRPGGV
jgi:hypothetical protein